MGGSEAVSENTNLNKSEQIKIAAHLLKMGEDEAAHNSSQLSDTRHCIVIPLVWVEEQ